MSETLRHLRYVLGENPVTLAAFALFVLLVATALLGPWIAPYNPLATDAMHALAAPSAAHWCGTDAVGRDISSRIIAATRPITRSRLRAALMTDPNTCRFYGRCPKGQNNCAAMMPELRAFDAGRSVACHFPEVVVRAETATAA